LFQHTFSGTSFVEAGALFKVKPDSVKVERFPEMIKGVYKVPRRFGRPFAKKIMMKKDLAIISPYR